MTCVNFAYRGRLDPEKGVQDLIVSIQTCIADFSQTPHAFHIDIRGSGTLQDQIKNLADIHHEHISYYGRMPREQIQHHLQDTHYTVMPSTFLETFGLVALESCSLGIPVIGYAKGGLKQFILPACDCTDSSLTAVMRDCICDFDQTTWGQLSHQSLQLIQGSTSDQRYDRFLQIVC